MENLENATSDLDNYRPMLDDFFLNHIPVTFLDVIQAKIDDSCTVSINGCIDDERGLQKGLLLSGPVGTGKTSALYVLFKHLIWKFFRENIASQLEREESDRAPIESLIKCLGRQFAFLTHFELIRQLRAYYERSNLGDEQPEIFRVPLLFIDDLGRGYDDKSGWNLALLDEFFDLRYQHRLRIFVTTNKTPQELRAWENWERIIDRLCDPSWMRTAMMGGKSKRTKEWPEKSD